MTESLDLTPATEFATETIHGTEVYFARTDDGRVTGFTKSSPYLLIKRPSVAEVRNRVEAALSAAYRAGTQRRPISTLPGISGQGRL